MIGTAIGGRYRLTAVVGTGAFATVYRAHDERLETDVALKVLAENHSLDIDLRERFINEARRLRQVGSPFVVGVYDLGETDRAQPFIVMELADRGDLAQRVTAHRQSGRPVLPDDVRVVARTLAGALAVMHARRVVHRDLTPRNLLLCSTGPGGSTAAVGEEALIGADERLLVGDLGLSKDLALASGITAAVGTLGFSPPEQRLGGGIDERADVYAASALLVWLLTGRAPDDGGSWPSAVSGRWSPGVTDVLSRGLSADRDRRPGSAAEWHAGLEVALGPTGPSSAVRVDGASIVGVTANEGSGGASAGPVSPRPGPAGRPRPPWWAVLVLVLALAVGSAGLAGWAVSRRAESPTTTEIRALGGGRAEARATENGLTASIEGPEELSVGQTATYTVDAGSASSWIWIGPDGRISPDAPSLDVVPESEGRVSVTLVAADPSGRTVRVVLTARSRPR